MSKPIRLGAISPGHLNLNGDLGNLTVLQKRLAWRGVKSVIESLDGSEKFSDFDLILLGHGSNAAWNELLSLRPELLPNLISYVEADGAFIAIGSAADRLLPLVGVEVGSGKRVSKFIDVDGVVGYKNSSSNSPDLMWRKKALFTQLHGPVLAKNPNLADQIIQMNEWAEIQSRSNELECVDELAAQSRRIAFEH